MSQRRGIVKLRMLFGSWYVHRWSGEKLCGADGPLSWSEAKRVHDKYISAGWGREQ
jgi:hypothetical protein